MRFAQLARPARFKPSSRNALFSFFFFFFLREKTGRGKKEIRRLNSFPITVKFPPARRGFVARKKGATKRARACLLSSHCVLDGEGGTEKSRVENRVTNCTSTRRVAVSTGCEQRVPAIQGVPAEPHAFVTQKTQFEY